MSLAKVARGLRWPALLALVVVGGLATGHAFVASQPYDLNVPFADAAGLYPGSDVLIAGSRAGTVRQIQLQGSAAVVTVALDPAHAPVRSDARATLRPKSLLGEKYIDLNPGLAGDAEPSGWTLPRASAQQSTELQDVFNTLDAPTRSKLQTVILELGGGVAGQGPNLNETFATGTTDIKDLAATAEVLRQRDAELQQVIGSLNQVTQELARSDRSQQLGALIVNANALLANLASQDDALKKALDQTSAALSRSDTALAGVQGNLNDIFHQSPVLVHQANLLTGDLASAMQVTSGTLGQCSDNQPVSTCTPGLLLGIREGPIVFGGRDANGYATRVTVIAGPGSAGLGLPGAGGLPGLPGQTRGASLQAPDALPGIFDFLLGRGAV